MKKVKPFFNNFSFLYVKKKPNYVKLSEKKSCKKRIFQLRLKDRKKN